MPLAASSPPHRTVPGALRLRRLALGLRQSDVASLSGLSREQIIRLEAGECDPRLSTAAAIASALRAELGEIFPTTSEAIGGQSDGFAKSDVVASRDARTG